MKINFYGCSFSDGGGMDRWDWFQGIKDEDWVDSTWREKILKQGHNGKGFSDLLFDFQYLNKFSTLVGKKLDCDIGDYAYTANNNQNIRDMVWKNIKEDSGKIHIVQWSIFERFKLWYDETEKFYRIHGDPYHQVAFEENLGEMHEIKDLQSFQTTRLLKHFNMDYEVQKVIMYTELLHSYAHDRGHHIYFMFHDIGNTQDRKTLSLFYRTPSDFSETTEPFTNANVITFDGLHLGHWIRKNNLTVESESKGHLKEDKHYSREGNLLIANKVIEILKKDNVIDG
tara:strand:+ start:51 stop:902 length:852 start_codon:yes stop_codon:yes gene_type:complete